MPNASSTRFARAEQVRDDGEAPRPSDARKRSAGPARRDHAAVDLGDLEARVDLGLDDREVVLPPERVEKGAQVFQANLSVAATRARPFGGSHALWPASGKMIRSASGQARWSAQALSIGHTTS